MVAKLILGCLLAGLVAANQGDYKKAMLPDSLHGKTHGKGDKATKHGGSKHHRMTKANHDEETETVKIEEHSSPDTPACPEGADCSDPAPTSDSPPCPEGADCETVETQMVPTVSKVTSGEETEAVKIEEHSATGPAVEADEGTPCGESPCGDDEETKPAEIVASSPCGEAEESPCGDDAEPATKPAEIVASSPCGEAEESPCGDDAEPATKPAEIVASSPCGEAEEAPCGGEVETKPAEIVASPPCGEASGTLRFRSSEEAPCGGEVEAAAAATKPAKREKGEDGFGPVQMVKSLSEANTADDVALNAAEEGAEGASDDSRFRKLNTRTLHPDASVTLLSDRLGSHENGMGIDARNTAARSTDTNDESQASRQSMNNALVVAAAFMCLRLR